MLDQINRNLLKYSAGRAITCPHCGQIADCRRWVLVTQGDTPASDCITKRAARLAVNFMGVI